MVVLLAPLNISCRPPVSYLIVITMESFFIHGMKNQCGLEMSLLEEGGGLGGVQQSFVGGWT